MTPAQLAEVTAGSEHKRLAGELQGLADMLQHLPLDTIADDAVFPAAQALHYWLAALVPAAERHREAAGLPVDAPAVVLLDEPDLQLEDGRGGPALVDGL